MFSSETIIYRLSFEWNWRKLLLRPWNCFFFWGGGGVETLFKIWKGKFARKSNEKSERSYG
jgi:hypothetical protein